MANNPNTNESPQPAPSPLPTIGQKRKPEESPAPAPKQLKKLLAKKSASRGIISIEDLQVLQQSGLDDGLNVTVSYPLNVPQELSKLSYSNLSTLLHTLLLHPQRFGSMDKVCSIRNAAALENVNVVFLNHEGEKGTDDLNMEIESKAGADSVVLSFALTGKGGGTQALGSQHWESVFQKPIQSKKASKNTSQTSPPSENQLLDSLRLLKLSESQLIENGYTTLKGGTTIMSEDASGVVELKDDDIVLGVDKYTAATTAETSPPLPSPDLQWFTLPSPPSPPSPPNVFGMDCEMVNTTHGTALARLTIVSVLQDGKTSKALDIFVKPSYPITDYLTRFSGITPETFEEGKEFFNIQEARVKLGELVKRGDYIVGHSLENDYSALRLVHPNTIDTAVLFTDISNSRKHGLKYLSFGLLQRRIQQNQSGHDSLEDCVASIDLAVLKAKLGAGVGMDEGKYFRSDKKSQSLLSELQKAIANGKTEDGETSIAGITKSTKITIFGDDLFTKSLAPQAPTAHAIANKPDEDLIKFSTKSFLTVARVTPSPSLISSLINDHDGRSVNVLITDFTRPYFDLLKRKKTIQSNPMASMTWSVGDEEELKKRASTCGSKSRVWIISKK
mmetsp:Transcript_10252/g.21071  ORF Transcript_10252/g.21071 Transcript_10252/m.21071 type:complete len:618 (-) Transcript_10252:19-1872(-)